MKALLLGILLSVATSAFAGNSEVGSSTLNQASCANRFSNRSDLAADCKTRASRVLPANRKIAIKCLESTGSFHVFNCLDYMKKHVVSAKRVEKCEKAYDKIVAQCKKDRLSWTDFGMPESCLEMHAGNASCLYEM